MLTYSLNMFFQAVAMFGVMVLIASEVSKIVYAALFAITWPKDVALTINPVGPALDEFGNARSVQAHRVPPEQALSALVRVQMFIYRVLSRSLFTHEFWMQARGSKAAFTVLPYLAVGAMGAALAAFLGKPLMVSMGWAVWVSFCTFASTELRKYTAYVQSSQAEDARVRTMVLAAVNA